MGYPITGAPPSTSLKPGDDAASLGSGGAADNLVLTADGAGGAAWEVVVGGGGGTVTSVAVSGSDGIQVDSGSPITASGTIALGVDASTLATHLGLNSAAYTVSTDYAAASHNQAASTISDSTATGRALLTAATVAAAQQAIDVEPGVDVLAYSASTGTGDLVRASSPTLVTPALGTPASGTLTNCTGLPEGGLATTDVTTGDTSTTKHGLAPKMVAPASGLMNVLGIANGETVASNKTIFDGLQKVAVVDELPGTPDTTTLYLVY